MECTKGINNCQIRTGVRSVGPAAEPPLLLCRAWNPTHVFFGQEAFCVRFACDICKCVWFFCEWCGRRNPKIKNRNGKKYSRLKWALDWKKNDHDYLTTNTVWFIQIIHGMHTTSKSERYITLNDIHKCSVSKICTTDSVHSLFTNVLIQIELESLAQWHPKSDLTRTLSAASCQVSRAAALRTIVLRRTRNETCLDKRCWSAPVTVPLPPFSKLVNSSARLAGSSVTMSWESAFPLHTQKSHSIYPHTYTPDSIKQHFD